MMETTSSRPSPPGLQPLPPDRGWYLYGITRRGESVETDLAGVAGLDGAEPLRILARGDLAAVVSRVRLSELGAEAVRARLQDAAWLETMVRGHERVVEAIHRQRTVLPAKFGSVYPTAADLVDALASARDAFLARLDRLEGHDEWGVRLYADRRAIRRRAAATDPNVRQLQQEIETARPGRAYFLQRKLADVLNAAAEQALSDLAQAAYDGLTGSVVAGRVSARTEQKGGVGEEVEILRAAFLVHRPGTTGFVEALCRFVENQEGLRCEYNGPWPPYSFASTDGEAPR